MEVSLSKIPYFSISHANNSSKAVFTLHEATVNTNQDLSDVC